MYYLGNFIDIEVILSQHRACILLSNFEINFFFRLFFVQYNHFLNYERK